MPDFPQSTATTVPELRHELTRAWHVDETILDGYTKPLYPYGMPRNCLDPQVRADFGALQRYVDRRLLRITSIPKIGRVGGRIRYVRVNTPNGLRSF